MLPVHRPRLLNSPLLRRWGFDPFAEVDRVANTWLRDDTDFGISVDVREDDANFYVEADVPGFSQDDINVTFDNGMLTVSGERKQEETREGDNFHVVERRTGKLTRSFSLPSGSVKDNAVEAMLKDGVLHITLAKADDVQPRKIEVKTE